MSVGLLGGGLKSTPATHYKVFWEGRDFVQGVQPPTSPFKYSHGGMHLGMGNPGNGGLWEWWTLGMGGQFQFAMCNCVITVQSDIIITPSQRDVITSELV